MLDPSTAAHVTALMSGDDGVGMNTAVKSWYPIYCVTEALLE
jgi:hypothetical protein